MNRIRLLAIFFTPAMLLGNNLNILNSADLSRRCKNRIDEITQKRDFVQSLNNLRLKNKMLFNQLRPEQKLVEKRLVLSKNALNSRLEQEQKRLRHMEEDLIRDGCPSFSL